MLVPGRLISLPLASTSVTAGACPCRQPAASGSITEMLDRPVISSVWRLTLMPSSTCRRSGRTRHLGDDRVGVRIPGRDHLAGLRPRRRRARSAPRRRAACSARARDRCASSTESSPERDTATSLPLFVLRRSCMLCRRTVPSVLTWMLSAAVARDAAPPMWKVRIVSCVPGSPIDCAAMTPIASPMLTR